MIARLGLRLALTRSPDHRWRQFALPLAGSLATFLVLLAAGLVAANQRQSEREVSRMPVLAASPSPGDVMILPRGAAVAGSQYLTIWIAASVESAIAPPPGLPRIPGPGEAFLSPALAAHVEANPGFGDRFPQWGLIGSNGLVSSDELLAYVGLPEDRLPERAHRVSGFGPVEGDQGALALTANDLPGERLIAAGVLLFLILPGSMLLYLGASAASAVRDHRFAILHSLGASRGTLVLLAVTETLTLLTPGVVAGALLWLMVASRLGPLPYVSMDPIPGDLVLPWRIAGAGCLSILLAGSAFAAAGLLVPASRTGPTPRPGRAAAGGGRYRVFPTGLAGLLLLARPWLPESVSGVLLISSLTLFLVSVPLLAPIVVRRVGRGVARVPTVPTLLAGRRLGWNPGRNARPHLAAAILLGLTLTVLGYQKLTDAEIRPAPGLTVAFATVGHGEVSEADAARLSGALQPALVVVFRDEGTRWLIGARCDDLARQLAGVGCDARNPAEFDDTGRQTMAQLLGLPAQLELVLAPELRFGQASPANAAGDGHSASPLSGRFHDGLFVLDAAHTPAGLEESVGTAAALLMPGSSVAGVSSLNRYYPPSWRWTVAGLGLAGAILALGTILPILDTLTSTRGERRHLTRIGLDEGRLRLLEGLLFGIPFLTVATIGLCAGLLSAWLLTSQSQPPASMPWLAAGFIAGAALVLAVAGSLATAVFGVRPVSLDQRD